MTVCVFILVFIKSCFLLRIHFTVYQRRERKNLHRVVLCKPITSPIRIVRMAHSQLTHSPFSRASTPGPRPPLKGPLPEKLKKAHQPRGRHTKVFLFCFFIGRGKNKPTILTTIHIRRPAVCEKKRQNERHGQIN
jgi:hypothetical protein